MNNQQTKYLKTPDFPGEDFNFFLKQNENVETFPVIPSKLKIIKKFNEQQGLQCVLEFASGLTNLWT